jgi:hypothetical protein
MGNLNNALQQLREERKQSQLHVERLDQAISVIESLNGSGTSRKANQPRRTLSASARRRISLAQKARWAKRAANGKADKPKPRRTISAAGRKKIAAAQRARWAKLKSGQKKAA